VARRGQAIFVVAVDSDVLTGAVGDAGDRALVIAVQVAPMPNVAHVNPMF
jgi:hypothetical protein